MLHRLAHTLTRRFRRDENGSISVEAMLVLPILIWCYLGTFVFFDGYRAQSVNVKASYTIGDMLSRETGFVTPAYMDSLHTLQQFLTNTVEPVRMRITLYAFDGPNDRYVVRWSQVRGGAVAPLTNTTLAALRSALPIQLNGEVAILTESWVGYEPTFQVGIDPFTFYDVVVTRPRFAPQLCWNSVENGVMATATC